MWQDILSWLTTEGIKIVIALVVLLVSFVVINWIVRLVKKWCIKTNFDATLGKVLRHLIAWTLKISVVVALLGYLGIDTAGIAALIASLGLGLGLAVQGSLGNIAGGALFVAVPYYIAGRRDK